MSKLADSPINFVIYFAKNVVFALGVTKEAPARDAGFKKQFLEVD